MTDSFQKYLEGLLGKKLYLKINNNRSTMLSVKWEPDCTRVSLHRMFLEAPPHVVENLAYYIKESNGEMPSAIRAYIDNTLKTLDYSHTVDRSKLCIEGRCFNLQELYNGLNAEYFAESLSLLITWFGKSETPSCSRRVELGLFHDQLKLIKVNRLLDQATVPQFFVRYVIYHEMLHFVCPPYIDEHQIQRIHSKEFKERERLFSHYEEAKFWIKDNRALLFTHH